MFAALNIVLRVLKLRNYFTKILYYNYKNKVVYFLKPHYMIRL